MTNNIMIGVIYVRSIVAIITIGIMMCYLNATDSLTEALLAIGMVVYIDKKLSGDQNE